MKESGIINENTLLKLGPSCSVNSDHFNNKINNKGLTLWSESTFLAKNSLVGIYNAADHFARNPHGISEVV